ncbi:MAG: cereblon family protein [Acidobacteriota bacterium]
MSNSLVTERLVIGREPAVETEAWCLRRGAASPTGDARAYDQVDTVLGRSVPRRLLCRACGEAVTADEHRVAIEGRHVHRRTNPVGFEFGFGCFAEAPGVVAVGEATVEHSWFAGCTWRYSVCGRCGAHLGWLFEGGGPRFQGLILNRLEEEEPPSGESE